MRVSLVARLVSHPSIDFGSGRPSSRRPRLAAGAPRTTYHRARRAASGASLLALRSETSRFRFPAVGRATRLPARRPALPFGLPRARRA
ncbi:MAG TPA: hypothetical protein VM253_04590 [Candidatus Limnocylindrales bacterium]|nr:hypothetical protein [Candidatus Limnocylindrales bacterium]